jgi:hypothetical protein
MIGVAGNGSLTKMARAHGGERRKADQNGRGMPDQQVKQGIHQIIGCMRAGSA